MFKKSLLALGAVLAVAAGVVGMSAFEAHVINVTAKIENALKVTPDLIEFGTVFPQEELYRGFEVALSQSFMDEGRVDDVMYRIRQKPKCGITTNEGAVLVDEPLTATAHVYLNETGEVVVECPPEPRELSAEESWGVLPLLCRYLSKHKDDPTLEKDEEMPAFHEIGRIEEGDDPEPTDDVWIWNDLRGHLTKKGGDLVDNWLLDLKVPCFGGACAQDWASFVARINPDVDPEDYVQPEENEHKIFGCDLWVEVTGISLPDGDIGCFDKPDLMLVLDRSGSINSTEMSQLKTAAKAFVTALAPASDSSHIGQSSFASNGSLDLHLSYNLTVIEAAIDGLGTAGSGVTNLAEGIDLADDELADDVHDRNDADSPDYMVIVTDGSPNTPSIAEGKTNAENEAAAAKAAGVTIYVVGVGTTEDTANWLKNNIATSVSHYFDVGDFSVLEDLLEDLAICD